MYYKGQKNCLSQAFDFLTFSLFFFCASQTLNSLKSILYLVVHKIWSRVLNCNALPLCIFFFFFCVHYLRPWTPKPSHAAFPHLLRNNTWLVKRREEKKRQIRRRKLIWMARRVGKLFIKMAIFLKDGCLNGSHVVRGSAQSDCILSRRKRDNYVLVTYRTPWFIGDKFCENVGDS